MRSNRASASIPARPGSTPASSAVSAIRRQSPQPLQAPSPRVVAPARVLKLAQLGIAAPQQPAHLPGAHRVGERAVGDPPPLEQPAERALGDRRVHEVGMLDDGAVAPGVELRLGLRREHDPLGPAGPADRERGRQVEVGVGELVDRDRVAAAVGEAVVPALAQVRAHLDVLGIGAGGDRLQRRPPPRGAVVGERPHRRGGGDRDRALAELEQHAEGREAVLAAAERERYPVATRAGGGGQAWTAVGELDRALEIAPAPGPLQGLDRGVDQPQPELALPGRQLDRELDPARPQQGPVDMEAEQGDRPPDVLRQLAWSEPVAEAQVEALAGVELARRIDPPAEADLVLAHLGRIDDARS